MKKEIIRLLAKYIVNTSFKDLPKEVIEKTKILILDCLAVSVGAYSTPWANVVIDIIKGFQGKKEATIFVDGTKVPVIHASLANGTLAHSLEFDDTHISTSCHPGSVIIPAAFAVAESQEISGEKIILSIVIAYEVMLRIGMAISPDHVMRGFHITSTVGNFGAATASAKILELDEETTINSLALSGDQASAGLFGCTKNGSMSKRIHAGRTAMNGVLSALFAQKGITGGDDILEGEYNFLRAYADNYDTSKITMGLGKRFEIMNCWCKQFPCCGHLQGQIRLALKMKNKHGIKVEDIKSIKVGTYRPALEFAKHEIKTPLDAQESGPFAVAAAFINNKSLYLDDLMEKYSDNQILTLANKVKVEEDEVIQSNYPKKCGNKLTVTLKNGNQFSEIEDHSLTISDKEILGKFKRLSRGILDKEKIERIIDKVEQLEEIENIKDFINLLKRR